MDVLDVSVSIVNHEVHVLHRSSVKSEVLCEVLADEAFEVSCSVTVDKDDQIVSEVPSVESPSDGWWPSPRSIQTSENSCIPLPRRTKRKRHVENCESCQTEDSIQPPVQHAPEDPRPENVLEKGTLPATDGTEESPPDRPIRTEPDVYTLELSVGGMTCASCTNAIKEAIQELDGVQTVDINLIANSAVVRYESLKSSPEKIIQTIEDIGYEASLVNLKFPVPLKEDTYRAKLSLGGMTCASCSNAIRDGLKPLDFIQTVDISLMTNSGVVVFTGKDNLSKIVESVKDLGYECSVESSEPVNQQRQLFTTKRTIQLKVTGMFCEHCPSRIVNALTSEYSSKISIDKELTLKSPIITITYQPSVPAFTIRSIVSTIDNVSKDFHTTVYHPPSIEDRSKQVLLRERKKTLYRLILCTLVAIPTFLIGVVWMSLVYEHDPTRMYWMQQVWAGDVTRAEWALFILATPVYFFAADVFHVRAIKGIRSLWRKKSKVPVWKRFVRFGSMDLLISAGTTVAYISSLALVIVGATTKDRRSESGSYFDTVVFLTFFILIGRYLEAYSKSKTGSAVSMLGKLRPQEATLLTKGGPLPETVNIGDEKLTAPSKTQTISTDLLEVGDSVIVPHGSSPPSDGFLASEEGKFDESSLTGESRPVSKVKEDTVYVGTINVGNPVTVEVSDTTGASMLDQIVAVVREGQTKRAPIERFADVLTGYFVPVITALAIITFFVWFALGQSGTLASKYLNGQTGGWAFWSLEFAIAVFVVACPCGIGLAAPTALFVGGGLAAKYGILVRGGGEAFQEAGYLDAIVFDKTGTLTEGDLTASDHQTFDTEREDVVWTIVRRLEEQSSHPIARAILKLATTKPETTIQTLSVEEVPGRGIRGKFATSETTYEAELGSEAWCDALSKSVGDKTSALGLWKAQAKSVVVLSIRRSEVPRSSWSVAAIFAVTDPVRPSALPTIKSLQSSGIAVYMLSGDNPTTAKAVAKGLGIPASNVFAGVLPTEKAEKIEWLQNNLLSYPGKSDTQESRRTPWEFLGFKSWHNRSRGPAKVAFVGDGINDAPALLAATVSVSLSTGSPIALTSSSFVLMSSSLLAIPVLTSLSARVFRRVKLNFAWALVYNVTLVPVAAGVLFKVHHDGWRLGPVWAAAAMAGSSVSVVLSSLALRYERGWKFWKKHDEMIA